MIAQDYCGILSEEAVRKNFVLVYELLDEVVDYGFPQSSSSDALKEFVLNEPVLIRPTVRVSLGRDGQPFGGLSLFFSALCMLLLIAIDSCACTCQVVHMDA